MILPTRYSVCHDLAWTALWNWITCCITSEYNSNTELIWNALKSVQSLHKFLVACWCKATNSTICRNVCTNLNPHWYLLGKAMLPVSEQALGCTERPGTTHVAAARQIACLHCCWYSGAATDYTQGLWLWQPGACISSLCTEDCTWTCRHQHQLPWQLHVKTLQSQSPKDQSRASSLQTWLTLSRRPQSIVLQMVQATMGVWISLIWGIVLKHLEKLSAQATEHNGEGLLVALLEKSLYNNLIGTCCLINTFSWSISI